MNMLKITLVIIYNLQINDKLDNRCLITSSVASPVCQEGQSERTFPILPLFPDFSLFFPIFGKFFAVRGGTLSSLTPPVATPL